MGGGGGAPEMDADSPWSVVGTVATRPQRGHSGGQHLKGGPLRGRQFGAWILAWGTRNQKQKGTGWKRLVRGTESVMVNTVHDTCLL